MDKFRTARRVAFACAALMALGTQPAAAQDSAAVDIQNFSPALGPYSIFATEGADVLGHLKFSGGAMLNYSSEPLIAVNDLGRVTAIVDQQLGVNLMAGVGLFEQFQVDLHMPLYLVNSGLYNGKSFSGFTPGDLALRIKGNILTSKEGPVGFGAMLETRAPTGNSEAFVGAGSFSVTPKFLVDARFGPVLVAANLGANFQSARNIRNLELNDEIVYGLGSEITFLEGLLTMGADIYGRTQIGSPFASAATSPLEGILGLKLKTPSGVSVISGAGGGLVGGFGAPEFRAFVGVSYATEGAPTPTPEPEPAPLDADEDGIIGDQDQCPDKPEDFDKYQDEDGCPEPDNDGDGIPDAEDKCRDEAGVAAESGCPIRDKDADGILDKDDACPEKPEDKDGWKDEDGCPEPDNDSDTVLDAQDQCKNEAEDVDGFQDKDGCPDPDNDFDGILDTQDQCKGEAETYNGATDADGCPDGPAMLELPDGSALVLKQSVDFKPKRATLLKRSTKLLDVVAVALAQNPRFTKIRVEGHMSDVGDDARNLETSTARANAVREYLVSKGIAPERLIAQGLGETQPACQGLAELTKTKKLARKNKAAIKACRATNERIAFTILELDGKPTSAK